jgi:hypothetical protein
MVFTTNQAKHFYVLSDTNTATLKKINGDESGKKGFYIEYKGPGGTLRSDIIKPNNVISM